ncbi:hypothetical protein AB0I04_54995, partial [Actinoallomurus sp. NPDC050550]
LDIHLICDNYGTHKRPAIVKWLESHPRFPRNCRSLLKQRSTVLRSLYRSASKTRKHALDFHAPGGAPAGG